MAAAEQGLPRAQIKLAEVYAREPGVAGNSIKACAWLLLATTRLRGANLQSAQSAYQRASLPLTPAQIAKAKWFAHNWRPNRPAAAATPEQPETLNGGHA